MSLISAKAYENAKVHTIQVKNDLWVSIKDVGNGLGVKNISDLVLKEIYGIYEKRKLTKEEINCFRMTEREIFEKIDNLNEDELNTKSNKNVYVKNNIMKNIIKHCRGEKKRGIKAIDGIREKLMIPDYEIYNKVKSKIGTIFANEKVLEQYSVRI